MSKKYIKPAISIVSDVAESVYAASGVSNGALNTHYLGVFDHWGTDGGKAFFQTEWSSIEGTITLNISFSDTIDDIETSDSSVQKSYSGNKATLTFASTISSPLTIGVHMNHGTNIDNLQITGSSYSVK